MSIRSVTRERLAWKIAELADLLGVSEGFLRLEAKRGALKLTRRGRRVLVLDRDLQRYLGGRTEREQRVRGAR